MKAINGEILDDGVDEPWLCPHCGLTEELCDCEPNDHGFTEEQMERAERLHDERRDRQWEEKQ